jgi:hypothetical protein
MKDEIQAKILNETEGMTTEEVLAYFRQKSERFDNEKEGLRQRTAKRKEVV